MNDPNIPEHCQSELDDQYCQWAECPICLGEWKGEICQCDCENSEL